MAEHPIIGAAIVEPLLGNDIAQAVLRHHERVDGRGYPSRLSGTAIPLPSRVICQFATIPSASQSLKP